MYNNAIAPDMGSVHMNRRQLAVALEAERLFGMRYEHAHCFWFTEAGATTRGQIRCSYEMVKGYLEEYEAPVGA